MKITKTAVRIGELIADFKDNEDEGVSAYGGLLDIRPAYQREFVYKAAQRNAVIDTVVKGFPLNIIYWVKNADGTFEVLDGQQRIMSICQYANGDFSVAVNGKTRGYDNLTPEQRSDFDDYVLDVYICEGESEEKLDWFSTINIAGETLTKQELRNATYVGPWLADAKRHFSRAGGPADGLGKYYLKGSPIRQEYLETVLYWAAHADGSAAAKDDAVKEYMARHQHDADASALWAYFERVIGWVKKTFPTYYSEMDGLEWGLFYNAYRGTITTEQADAFEARIPELMEDDEVTKKSGIFLYLLSGDPRWLSLRSFTLKQKREAYVRQNGVCVKPYGCGQRFEITQMEGDHISPWSEGGRTTSENCQMLCKKCNGQKGATG